jgi:DNA repair protein RadC
MRDLEQEELHVVLLDTRNRVLDIRAVYRGSLNTSMVRIAELFRPAIEAPAAAIIVAHNHPSGCVDASPEDVRVTREISKAGHLLGIDVLDHIIVGAGVFLSMKERQLGFD